MDTSTPTLSVIPPRLSHRLSPLSASSSPMRSPVRQRITDDLLSDLSPTTTLEAFTSPSGKLRESIEAATPVERAFGIRATLASKKIQEWVDELSAWPWPSSPGPDGFELPSAKRRKVVHDADERQPRSGYPEPELEDVDPSEYMGSLPTQDVLAYEVRVEEIQEDMEDLNVEEIKRTVLNNYFSPNSRPSSSSSSTLDPPSFLSRYTKMDDFTAVVAATVLQALPNLSRLMRLMDVWSTRLSVLRKIPPLMQRLDDAEVALKSGWHAIRVPEDHDSGQQAKQYLERATFEVMRNVLQNKVTTLGQDLDRMLDRLEGREDTLPDHWLDRMEAIETNYGNWVVSGDRKVREGEWAVMALRKKEEVEKLKAEEETRKSLSQQEERTRQDQAEKVRLGVEAARLKAELARKEKEESLRIEREVREEVALLEQERVQRIIDEELRLQKEKQEKATEIAKQEGLRNAEQVDKREIFESPTPKHQRESSRGSLRQSERLSRIFVLDGVPDSEDDMSTSIVDDMNGLDGNSESKVQTPKSQTPKKKDVILEFKDEMDFSFFRDSAPSQPGASAPKAQNRFLIPKDDCPTVNNRPDTPPKNLFSAMDVCPPEHNSKSQQISTPKEPATPHQVFTPKRISTPPKEDFPSPKQVSTPTISPARKRHSPDTRSSKDGWMVDEDLMLGLSGGVRHDDATEARLTKKFQNKSESELYETDKYAGISEFMVKRNAAFREKHHLKPPRSKSHRRSRSDFDGADEWNDEDEEMDLSQQHSSDNQIQSETLGDDKHNDTDSKQVMDYDHPPSPVQHFIDQTHPGPIDDVFPSRARSPSSPSRNVILFRNSSQRNSSQRNSSQRNSPQGNRRSSLPSCTFGRLRSESSGSRVSSPLVPDNASPRRRSSTPKREEVEQSSKSTSLRPDSQEKLPQVDGGSTTTKRSRVSPESKTEASYFDAPALSKRHSRNISLISGYSISYPSPEVHEAEPEEYFRHQPPAVTPIKAGKSEPTIPAMIMSPTMIVGEVMPTLASSNSSDDQSDFEPQSSIGSVDGANESTIREHELCDQCYSPFVNNLSAGFDQTNYSPLPPPGDGTAIRPTADTPGGESTPVLKLMSPGASEDGPEEFHPKMWMRDLPSLGEDSPQALGSQLTPSKCRGFECSCTCPRCSAQHHNKVRDQVPEPTLENPSKDDTKASSFDSLALDMETPERRDSSPVLSIADRMTITKSSPIIRPIQTTIVADIPPTTIPEHSSPVVEAPPVPHLEIAHPAGPSLGKGITTDDQIQAQLSSLLKSIPTNIKLSNEAASDTPPVSRFSPSQNDSLKLTKTRRSLPPFVRPSSSLSQRSPSSLSNRSATPAFTLQPASKYPIHRHGAHPEIRVYHLSRHGDAPIKLHIRRVGENGERLMVRTGGGWADLGEYLTAYISHHGRRIASGVVGEDKVEVENLSAGNRSVSGGGSTLRPRTSTIGGRDSPAPPHSSTSRPASVLGGERDRDRPVSSLYVQKSRPSVGEYSERGPNTPIQPQGGERMSTPASASSGLHDAADETGRATAGLKGLGLAGPGSGSGRKGLGKEEQEWVRSTTEKVRIASAEKEWAKERADKGKNSKGGGGSGSGSRGESKANGNGNANGGYGEERRRLFKS